MIPWMGNMTFFLQIVGEEDYPLCVHLSLAFMLHGLILAKGKDLIVQSHVLSSRSPYPYQIEVDRHLLTRSVEDWWVLDFI